MATLNTTALPAASIPRRAVQAAPQQTGLQPPPATAPVRSVGSQPLATPFAGQAPYTGPVTSTTGSQTGSLYAPRLDEAAILDSYINQLASRDSALMRNARIVGLEQAAGRGLQNSSIAAGASQRAALDSLVPMAQTAMSTFDQREGRQWTAEQNQLDRDQQITMSEVQNWLNHESFMREFNAQLATFPISNTAQLLNMIAEQSITNPEIYTPDVVSGITEFFTTNFLDVLGRYFPSMYQANTGG